MKKFYVLFTALHEAGIPLEVQDTTVVARDHTDALRQPAEKTVDLQPTQALLTVVIEESKAK